MSVFYSPVQANEMYTEHELGRGVKFSDKVCSAQPVFLCNPDRDFLVETPSGERTKCAFVQSTQDVSDLLGLDFTAALKVKIFVGELSGGYLSDTLSSTNEVILVYNTERYFKVVQVNENSSTLTVNPHLNSLVDTQEITELYGTHYISSILYGASLLVFFKLKNTDTEHMMKVRGSLTGGVDFKILRATVTGEVQYNQTTTSSQTEIHCEMYSRGGNKEFMEMPFTDDVDKVFAGIDAFKPTLNDPLKVVGYRIRLIPKYKVPNLNLTSSDIAAYNTNSAEASSILLSATELKMAAERQRAEIDKIESDFFVRNVKTQFMRAVNNIIAQINQPIQLTNSYLEENPMFIARNKFRSWTPDQQAQLTEELQGIMGLSSIPFSLVGVNGSYSGYLIDNLPIYLGEFKAARFSDPTRYMGGWLQGQRWDYGVMYFQNLDVYEGNWYENLQDGYGKMTFHDGRVEEGLWKKGVFQGSGTRISASRSDNKNSIILTIDDEVGVYTGEIVKGMAHGRGEFKSERGSTYHGLWHFNHRTHGKMTWANGNEYSGAWQRDKMHGFGKMKHATGEVYEGVWHEGNKHDTATL